MLEIGQQRFAYKNEDLHIVNKMLGQNLYEEHPDKK